VELFTDITAKNVIKRKDKLRILTSIWFLFIAIESIIIKLAEARIMCGDSKRRSACSIISF
jgi:hypothetical protein